MHACMHACIHTYKHTHTYVCKYYICVYVYITNMCVCVGVCSFVYIDIYAMTGGKGTLQYMAPEAHINTHIHAFVTL